jgi:hypothetical protein
MNPVQLNFDASRVEPLTAFDVLPSGWQNAYITDSGVEPTKDGTGQRLKLELKIADGPYAGRKVFDGLNLQNSNPATVEIAYKTLSSICRAVGVMQLGSTSELHNKPLMIKLKTKAARTTADGKEYEASNEIRGYEPYGSPHQLAHDAPALAGGVAGAPAGVPTWAAGGAAAAAAIATPPLAAPPVVAAAGMPAQPWQQPAIAAAQPVAAPPLPTAAAPVRQMLPAAKGATYEACIAGGWTDDLLVANGYMQWVQPAQPAAPPLPTAAAPPLPTPPLAATQPPVAGSAPPWMQG